VFLAMALVFSVRPAMAQQVAGARYFPAEPEVGGFVMEVKGFKGKGLDVRKIAGLTSERKQEPQAYVGLDRVDIEGLVFYKNLTLADGRKMNICIKTQNPTDVVIVRKGKYERDFQTHISELYGKKLVAGILDQVPVTLNDYWNTKPEDDLLFLAGSKVRPSFEGTIVKMNAHSLKLSKISIPNLNLTIESGHRIADSFGSPDSKTKMSDSLGLSDGLDKKVEALTGITGGLVDWLGKTVVGSDFGEVLGNPTGDLSKKAGPILTPAGDLVGDLSGTIGNLTGETGDIVGNVVNDLGSAVSNLGVLPDSVVGIVYDRDLPDGQSSDQSGTVGNLISDVGGTVGNVVGSLGKTIGGLLSGIGKNNE
jgi:hypothetical protein